MMKPSDYLIALAEAYMMLATNLHRKDTTIDEAKEMIDRLDEGSMLDIAFAADNSL